MSVHIYPEIDGLDKDGVCYKLYRDLYQKFFNVHDPKTADAQYGIEEGDQTSIRLHNMAYNFASSFAQAFGSDSGLGGSIVLSDYIKKAGDSMLGIFSANYGFNAGIDNKKVLETVKGYSKITADGEASDDGISLHGSMFLPSDGLVLGGRVVLWNDNETTCLQNKYIDFGSSILHSTGSIQLGDPQTGLYLSADNIRIGSHTVYHTGNANLKTVDWVMGNAWSHGTLQVEDRLYVSNGAFLQGGYSLGHGNGVDIFGLDDKVQIKKVLNFFTSNEFAIHHNDIPVLIGDRNKNVSIVATGGHLNLGQQNTLGIQLFSALFDINRQYRMISPTGAFYIPESLTVRHNFGEDLLSSYRKDKNDQGIIIHENLRFLDDSGTVLSGMVSGLEISTTTDHLNLKKSHSTRIYNDVSNSVLFSEEKGFYSTVFDTSAGIFRFNQAVEVIQSIGIDGSYTRLEKNTLHLSEGNYLLSATDGIRHFGSAYFMAGLSSEYFAAGFAGSGWAIMKNQTTGNTAATFDEITVRKKMRVYEMDIKKITATNGSLWVSDSCSGDQVELYYG